ncbi:unnamed protein product [Discosporangium mesarthrocarpum]
MLRAARRGAVCVPRNTFKRSHIIKSHVAASPLFHRNERGMIERIFFAALTLIGGQVAPTTGFLLVPTMLKPTFRLQRTGLHMAKGFGLESREPPKATCPCHSGKPYSKCCRPYHLGLEDPTPVELLRARYCAYAKGMPDYIMETTDSRNQDYGKPKWKQELQTFCDTYRFTGLDIGPPEPDYRTENIVRVNFRAYMTGPNGKLSFDERSVFLRDRGGVRPRWVYVCVDEDFDRYVTYFGSDGTEAGEGERERV